MPPTSDTPSPRRRRRVSAEVPLVLGHELVAPVTRPAELGPDAPLPWREEFYRAQGLGLATWRVLDPGGREALLTTNGRA